MYIVQVIWTPQLRPLMLKMSQMRSDARCFEYGEHILPHARHPPQDQGDKWSIASTKYILKLFRLITL